MAPPPSATPNYPQSTETTIERAIRRTKENPVIPIATAVAVWSVLSGSRKLFRRDSKGLQKSMRTRVAAQTVAFGALGVSLFYEAYYKNAKKEEAPAAVKPKEAAKPDAKA